MNIKLAPFINKHKETLILVFEYHFEQFSNSEIRKTIHDVKSIDSISEILSSINEQINERVIRIKFNDQVISVSKAEVDLGHNEYVSRRILASAYYYDSKGEQYLVSGY